MAKPRNPYRVPRKQWTRWSDRARAVFNALYKAMTEYPDLYWHPKQQKISPRFWRTTAWNASWVAADTVDGR